VGAFHLLVEELDDRSQLAGDFVGDEDEPQPASAQVGGDVGPEGVGIDVGAEMLLQSGLGVGVRRFEGGSDALDSPVGSGVRGIVEHLADDGPPNARIGAALDLDEGGNALLVEEQVIEAPAVAPVGVLADAHLSSDQQPALARFAALVAYEQIRMIGEQLLQDALGVVALLGHLDQPAALLDVDGHAGASVPKLRRERCRGAAKQPHAKIGPTCGYSAISAARSSESRGCSSSDTAAV
jgi:hypothetical protein